MIPTSVFCVDKANFLRIDHKLCTQIFTGVESWDDVCIYNSNKTTHNIQMIVNSHNEAIKELMRHAQQTRNELLKLLQCNPHEFIPGTGKLFNLFFDL